MGRLPTKQNARTMTILAVVRHRSKTLRIKMDDEASASDLAKAASSELGVNTDEVQLIAQGSEMEPKKSLRSIGEFWFRSNAVHVRKLDPSACREWQKKGRCKLGSSCPCVSTHNMHYSPRYVEHANSPSASPPASPPPSPVPSTTPPPTPPVNHLSPGHFHYDSPPQGLQKSTVLLSEPSPPPPSPGPSPLEQAIFAPSIANSVAVNQQTDIEPQAQFDGFPYNQYSEPYEPYEQYGQYEQYEQYGPLKSFGGWAQAPQGPTVLLSEKHSQQQYDYPPQQLEQAWQPQRPMFYGHYVDQNLNYVDYGAVNYNP